MMVTVTTERMSDPWWWSGVDEKSVSSTVGLWNFQGMFPIKKNTAQAAQRWILSGWIGGKTIGCVAGRLIFQGWSTARQCSKWTRPHLVDDFKPIHKIGGICDREYHGLQGASRWFCDIYCDKVVIVGFIFNTRPDSITVSHIVMFADTHYNAFATVGHNTRWKDR